ncbi:hypothetical protein KVR01_011523 [Diaporthe batatas]|uniref:uncharacterized protein n=1 Tax=Diaporthe batatas TaxID=748121 RepID=UPI001D038DE8|nr:uncharacterized protein KVR01_011523 [Diaporthe batatas]KAG8158401.1 hypothetical protein KVR01_011523 [Diaporthe batatas]
MKFSAAAVLAVAAGASAWENVTYTTEIVTAITTFCPEATTFAHAGSTYTVSSATTLTITDCPGGCTITKPVTTISSVACSTCAAPSPPVYPNGTAPAVPTTAVGTGSLPTTTGSSPETTAPVTAGAGKAVAMSGAGLAGVLGLAAFFL